MHSLSPHLPHFHPLSLHHHLNLHFLHHLLLQYPCPHKPLLVLLLLLLLLSPPPLVPPLPPPPLITYKTVVLVGGGF